MPGRDGSGPAGMGPLTGRGLGNCISYGLPIVAGALMGFGFGRGRGRGQGFGNRNFAQRNFGWRNFIPGFGAGYNEPSKQEELSYLKEEASLAENALSDIKQRISELEKE